MNDVLNQVLWYNDKICTTTNKHWYQLYTYKKGVTRIRDIYCAISNAFLTYNQFTLKYGGTLDVVQYHALIASIPADWKVILRQKAIGETHPVGLAQIPNGIKLLKFLY